MVASNRSTVALVLEATINACYAKSLKSLGGLKYAEEAKKLMLEADKQAKTPPQAVNIYRTLGTLYYKIPAWPIGFGDKKLAKAYLDKALALDPNGIDINYVYADFLSEQKAYANAVNYYKRALSGAPSTEGSDADKVRLKEAEIGLHNN